MTELELGILDELNEILDLERAAIMRGDIKEVGKILDRKEQQLTALRGFSDAGADELLGVKDKIDRNQSLLSSSMRGIKAVSDRLATIQKINDTLEVYDREGKRKMFNMDKGTKVERRA